ncbi:hypothetical protein GGR54DRAFT_651948 [Hypoxylon sp. NC1633]|nr:hypothetical protein GGR54DRAFT_651948 [Hypoxylon sp. NC1633]
MINRMVMGSARVAVIFLLTQAFLVNGLSWRTGPRGNVEKGGSAKTTTIGGGLSKQPLGFGSGQSLSAYEVALNELRELESEPLCHRTAARLLVNNCQLLEDKNEATALTDSGRKIRDFVDSYAASLAICDLERGSFQIPRECANFRESILNHLPPQNSGHLHNTWVSYRHKALRFCEAARAENDKDEHIFLFQRLTKTMGKFTDGLDKDFEGRMSNLDMRAKATGNKIDQISLKVNQLEDVLKSAEESFLVPLADALKDTLNAANLGTENALNLQKILEVILKTALDGQAQVAFVHEQSLQVANQRVESAMDIVMQTNMALAESAAQIQNHIELSRLREVELEFSQGRMQRLAVATETLTANHNDHVHSLSQARNMTFEILDTLENTAAAASYVSSSLLKQSSGSSWWPYIWCPAASLVLGSYGLSPSMSRNLVLLALGEAAGFAVSSIHSIYLEFPILEMVKFYGVLSSREDSFPTSSTRLDDTNQTETIQDI